MVGNRGRRKAPPPSTPSDERLRFSRMLSGPATRRVGWGVGDQALSSLTNMGLNVMVARQVSPAQFGAFSLFFAFYLFALNASRALTTEPLAVRFSAADRHEWRRGTAAAAGVAVTIGTAAGALCLLIALALRGPWMTSLVALGFMMPGLLLQDCYRFAFFTAGRGLQSFLNDLTWAIVLFPALFVVHRSVPWFVFVWGAAATVAAAVGALQAQTLPAPGRVRSWWREQQDLAPRFLIMFVARNGATQLSTYAVAALVGLAAAGRLRAAQVLLGPLTVLFLGVRLIGVPEGVRLLHRSHRQLHRGMFIVSVVLAVSALMWGGALLLIPSRIGVQILGRSWGPARGIVLPVAIAMAGSGYQTGAVVGMRALAAARRGMRTQLVEGTMTFLGVSVGAVLGGAIGAAYGLALAYLLEAGLWWWQFGRALATPDGQEDADAHAREVPR
jgi:hypothetical protein